MRPEFTGGLVFVESAKSVIDETYTLPQGKVSTCVNRANQLALSFSKDGGKGSYRATIFKDQEAGLPLTIDTRELGRSDTLKLTMQDRGGFVLHLAPLPGK